MVFSLPVLHDEIRHLLHDLAMATGATRVAIEYELEALEELELLSPPLRRRPAARRFPLGKGAHLELERPYPSTNGNDDLNGEQRMAVERTVRAVRACVRRWQAERAPVLSVSVSEPLPPDEDQVRVRMIAFLQALANIHNAVNVMITLRGRVVASSAPVTELQRERIPFTLRRVTVEAARRPGRSHADLAGDDFYASSFWFGAHLVAFFSGPYAVDFFRHRARMVIRELALLMPLIEEPPPASANVAPIPE